MTAAGSGHPDRVEGRRSNTGAMTFLRRGLILVVLLLAACSSSPEEDIVEHADEACREMSERFRGDLAFGAGVGDDDMDKLRERVALVRRLRDDVRGMPPPESGQDQLAEWLSRIDAYAEELENFAGQHRQARPGSDLLLALQLNVIDGAARESGTAAAAFGLRDCADVGAWIAFPK
jgi:hypothetical protein